MYAQNGIYDREDNASNRDSNTVIIFIPNDVLNLKSSQIYLHGDFEVNQNSTRIFYIFKTDLKPSENCVGVYNVKKLSDQRNEVASSTNWITLENNKSVVVKKLKFENELQDVASQKIILLFYDVNAMCKIDVLFNQNDAFVEEDYFKNLAEKIHLKNKLNVKTDCRIISALCFFLLFLQKILEPFTKFSNIALHFQNYLEGFIWALNSIKNKRSVNIKVINFFLSTFLDMFLGILFLNWLTSRVSLDSFPRFFLITAENVVNSLRELLQWLTGDPAGLKLNLAFNKMLATFFLFHIDIWWGFLGFLKPGLKFTFLLFLYVGQLGLTFQASITADLLGLVSFHVYCVYAYAARLYNIQISALIALWRLFLGRKKNPLRKKVDSCRYSPEQLFVGTIGFTILLFLLPTTLVYYFVFTFMRVLIVIYGEILTQIRWLVHSLPIYSTFLWLINSSQVCSNIQLIPEKSLLKPNFLVLVVKPIPYSWWRTIQQNQPDCVKKLQSFNLINFLSLIVSGQLIYPVDLVFLNFLS